MRAGSRTPALRALPPLALVLAAVRSPTLLAMAAPALVLGGRGEKGEKLVLGEVGEEGEKGVAATTGRVGAAPVVAEVQERTAPASDTSSPPKEMNAERGLRTLRTQIAKDPEAFIAAKQQI